MSATIATLPLRPFTLLLIRRSDEMIPAIVLFSLLEVNLFVKRTVRSFVRRLFASESPVAELVSAVGLLALGTVLLPGPSAQEHISEVFPLWFWILGMLGNGIGQLAGLVLDVTAFRRLFGLGAISVHSMLFVVTVIHGGLPILTCCLAALMLCAVLAWIANLRNAG